MMALVVGGASSGKSAYAEQLACSLGGPLYYLAAMKPFGAEGARRIARHRAMRAGKGFATVECYEGLEPCLRNLVLAQGGQARGGTALLESMGNVAANELFADDGTQLPAEAALEAMVAGVRDASRAFANLVIVGDDVGGDGIRYDAATDAYVALLGGAQCRIAQVCDLVVECVAGCPQVVKGTVAR